MGENALAVRKQQSKQIEAWAKRTHFSVPEIEGLLQVHRKLCDEKDQCDRLDRSRFRDFLHGAFDLTDDVILDRVFKHFDSLGDNDANISRDEWVAGMSVFLKGGEGERVRYCFSVYDLNGDGHVTRDEMLTLLKTSLGSQGMDEDQDEGVKDLVEMALKKFDLDKDGRISLQDWSQTIQREPLLLQAFGPCLPLKRDTRLFLQHVLNQ